MNRAAYLRPTKHAMPEPVSLIMRQFLAWIAERPRRREEVREAWRSCPRISMWEDAVMEGLVAYDGDGLIGLTPRGRDLLPSPDERAARRPGPRMSPATRAHAGYDFACTSATPNAVTAKPAISGQPIASPKPSHAITAETGGTR
jgi:hypothetical protein